MVAAIWQIACRTVQVLSALTTAYYYNLRFLPSCSPTWIMWNLGYLTGSTQLYVQSPLGIGSQHIV